MSPRNGAIHQMTGVSSAAYDERTRRLLQTVPGPCSEPLSRREVQTVSSISRGDPRRQAPGIETPYKGVRFRSRLEARWAAFFDGLGLAWEYEPFDAEGYIPDFAVFTDPPRLLEVKPAATHAELAAPLVRATQAVAGRWKHSIAAVGLAPDLVLSTDGSTSWGGDPGQTAKAWAQATNCSRWDVRTPQVESPGICHCGEPWGPYRQHETDHTRLGRAMAARCVDVDQGYDYTPALARYAAWHTRRRLQMRP